jgi:pimeloyl-ACP methyl ester carboxylesterase
VAIYLPKENKTGNATMNGVDRFSKLIQILIIIGLMALPSVAPVWGDASSSSIGCAGCSLCNSDLCCCHQPPELWLINTRCAPRCCHLDQGMECLSFQRFDCECERWVDESLESFLAQEASLPTMFYVHGNSLNHENAMKACGWLYKKMCCCPGRKRLVMWSWPAERVFGLPKLRVREIVLKNLKIKYDYAEYQGYYLANVVNRMSLSQRVTLTGHSYGGITAAAALHYLGAGCLNGLTLDGGAPVERANLRGVILAGAMDHDTMYPGCRYGQAFVAAELIWNSCNLNDRTLRQWHRVSDRGCEAIGCVGINAARLGDQGSKLCQQSAYPEVRRRHRFKVYLKNPRIVSTMCCLAFGDCQGEPTPAVIGTTCKH